MCKERVDDVSCFANLIESFNTVHSLEKTYNSKLMGCETSRDCGDMLLEESMNCVTHCVSPVCHKEIQYDINPLEDGEVDEGRAIAFAQCVKNEILKERADARKN